MTTHFRLTAVCGVGGMTQLNIFYCSASVTTPPVPSESIGRFYTPLLSFLSEEFTCVLMRYSLWEGPESGEWWELGADGKKHPKAAPPWGIDYDLSWTGVQGTATGQMLPPFCAGVIVAKTNVKKTRSRKFVGAFTEDGQAGGGWGSAEYAALQSAGNAWLAGFGGGSSPSYTSECWGPIHGFNNLQSVKASSIVGSQDHRKIGRGI